MQFFIFVAFLLSNLSFAVAANATKLDKQYINPHDIYPSDEGFYFKYDETWCFAKDLQMDSHGPYVYSSSIFRMWWCSTCRQWISDDTEICPWCGKKKEK